MAMRLSGLMSGMDTDSVIQELVAARRVKVDNAVKAQTKLEWKQEAWKELNTKLKNLQSKYISNLRFSSSYSKKTSKVSDETKASVITGQNAVNSVQTLQVKQLAKTAYLTGAEIEKENGGKATALTKLSELKGWTDGASGTISLSTGGKNIDIEVNGDTTISSILTKVKEAGLNANFDANNQRFFISAKESGVAADFSFTASGEAGSAALQALGLQESLTWNDNPAKLSATMQEYAKWADYYAVDENGAFDHTATLRNLRRAGYIDSAIAEKEASYLNQYKNLLDSRKTAEDKIAEIQEKYKDSALESADTYTTLIDEKKAAIEQQEKELENIADPDAKAEAEAALSTAKEELADLETKKADAETLANQEKAIADIDAKIANVEKYVDITTETDENGEVTYSAASTKELRADVYSFYIDKAAYASEMVEKAKAGATTGGATKVNGQDAEIVLNGATFKGSDNSFEINGLTITALNETKDDEVITITTQDDVDGIYDMVKDFLKEYNSIINEMDKLYNAESAKGFEPMTDEEKEAVSETEAEKYEKKIKDALLRRDSNLNSISSALQSAMSAGYTVNGKTMYLSDFGINTLGYFNAPDNEKHAYYIDGDADNATTSGKTDKLKSMISSDPDTVISFFTSLGQELYTKMNDMTRSVNGYRSFGSFYDDKKMKTDYTDYTSKIANMEEKLLDYEDKWYAKFAAMETAMAKMQSNMNAVTGMLGGM